MKKIFCPPPLPQKHRNEFQMCQVKPELEKNKKYAPSSLFTLHNQPVHQHPTAAAVSPATHQCYP